MFLPPGVRAFAICLQLGLLALLLLVSGVQDYVVFQQNPSPAEMTLGEYLQATDKPEWVHLTNCQVDYPTAVCMHNHSTRVIYDISAPVYPDGGRGVPAKVILAVNGTYPESTYRAGIVAENQPIQGLVRSGFSFNSKLWPFWGLDSKLKRVAKFPLDDQYIVIDEGAQPNSTKAFWKIGGACALALFSVWGFSRMLNRNSTPINRTPPPMSTPYSAV